MRIYKHGYFQKWASSENLTDEVLKKVIVELTEGLHDGNLGGGLFKKRLRMQGKGKRGSYRTLIAFKQEARAFFVYGFSKNERENITLKEQAVYKDLAKVLLNLEGKTLENMLKIGTLIEVT